MVPLSEEDLYASYQAIAGAGSSLLPVVHSVLTVAISANQTVVWYDHHEDGYDESDFAQVSTVIFGDANATNGCSPAVVDCTDEDDILLLGDVLTFKSAIAVPRSNVTTGDFFFDSGDMLYADYPITVSRSTDADIPGTNQALSGAVEVVDDGMMFWGRDFVSPVGPEFETATESFEMVKLFITSGEDDNDITMSNGDYTTLMAGESLTIDVHMGDEVKTSKDSLAHLMCADMNSTYEMRFLSLLPEDAWSSEYIAPVGDDTGSKSANSPFS